MNSIYRNALRIWSWALATPILYLGVAWGGEALGWVERDSAHPYDTPLARGIMFGLGAALIVIAPLWRWRRIARVRRRVNEPELALAGWRNDFFIVAMIADTLAFLGLVGFIITGMREAVLIGGGAAYVVYALAYPARNELERVKSEG